MNIHTRIYVYVYISSSYNICQKFGTFVTSVRALNILNTHYFMHFNFTMLSLTYSTDKQSNIYFFNLSITVKLTLVTKI